MTGGSHAGGGVGSTTFVAGIPLADWHLDSVANPGPFDLFAAAVHGFDVGSVVRLSSRLTVGARAEQDAATAESNAFNSSVFYVDVLTPGGGVVFPVCRRCPSRCRHCCSAPGLRLSAQARCVVAPADAAP